jgi:hypothetical protein
MATKKAGFRPTQLINHSDAGNIPLYCKNARANLEYQRLYSLIQRALVSGPTGPAATYVAELPTTSLELYAKIVPISYLAIKY